MNTARTHSRVILVIIMVLCLVVSMSSVSFAQKTSKVNGTTYYHPLKYRSSDYTIYNGIDVSYWQYGINWTKVKKAGIDFAFIRCGYTASGSFKQYEDSYFKSNIENAFKAGVNVGIYFWSEATTKAEAKAEAKYVNSLLEPYKDKIKMPVAMDYEFASGFRSTKVFNSVKASKGAAAARKRFTNNAKAFMNAIEGYGYIPMFYSYRGLVDSSFSSAYKLNMDQINGKNQYKFWLAQYSTDNSYSGSFEFWQHTSSGSVNGISGRCDRNFWYYNNSAIETKADTTSIKDCSVTVANALYSGSKKTPTVTVKHNGNKLKKGTDYILLYLENVEKGKASVIVRGIGKYSNEALKKFTITDKDIADAEVSDIPDKTYSGSAIKPTPTVTYKGTKLTKGTDYSLSYSNNTNAGTGTVTIKGKGNYAGSKKATFTIKPGDGKVTPEQNAYDLVAGNSLTISATTNGGALTYSSSDTGIATVNNSGKVTSTGTPGTVKITIKSAATDNVSAAKATVTINVISSTEKVKLKSVESPSDLTFTANWKKAENTDGYIINYAKTKDFKNSKSVTIDNSSATFGTVTSEITAGKLFVRVCGYVKLNGKKYTGEYSDPIKVSVVAPPAAPVVKKLVKTDSETFKLTWKPVEGANGYRIVYSDNKKFSGKKTVTVKKGTTKAAEIKSAYGTSKVFVKIRAYKTVGGKKYLGDFSEKVLNLKME